MIEIIKSKDFDEQKKNHEKLYTEDERYKESVDNTTFVVGRKLILNVTVTNKYLSSNLMALLFKRVPGQELLGVEVDSIMF